MVAARQTNSTDNLNEIGVEESIDNVISGLAHPQAADLSFRLLSFDKKIVDNFQMVKDRRLAI